MSATPSPVSRCTRDSVPSTRYEFTWKGSAIRWTPGASSRVTNQSLTARRLAAVSTGTQPCRGDAPLVSARPFLGEELPLSVLQAIVLGLTQGVTEFAPVSSSGHLILVPWLFGWKIVNDPALNKTFDVALHIGTLIGALIYFRHDVALYLGAWIRSIRQRAVRTTDERLAGLLIPAT